MIATVPVPPLAVIESDEAASATWHLTGDGLVAVFEDDLHPPVAMTAASTIACSTMGMRVSGGRRRDTGYPGSEPSYVLQSVVPTRGGCRCMQTATGRRGMMFGDSSS